MARGTPYEYKGVRGLRAIGEHVGISESTLRGRLNGNGKTKAKTLEEAIAMGKDDVRRKQIIWNGIEGVEQIAAHIGIAASTLQTHMRIQGSIEAAVDQAVCNLNKMGRATPRYPTCLSRTWRIALGMQADAF